MKLLKNAIFGIMLVLPVFVFSTAYASDADLLMYASDTRYVKTKSFVEASGFALDENRGVVRDAGDISVLLIPVIDNFNKEKGILSISKKIWTLSMMINGIIGVYDITIDDYGKVSILKKALTKSLTSVDAGNSFIRVGYRGYAKKVSLTGYDWCMYTSEVGFNMGCWNPSSNPFAYYNVTTYRKGDPITWDHYGWYADWRGYAVACPLNEVSGSPFKWVQCGFPPD